ncbi:putative gustatory receptor 28a [Vespula maculifrons]|uniref:Gustatory receptor 28a n=1 Tax=Vespula maculifrons TaxID=7453 RepID=A0ABD2CNX0_VESMC
MDEMKVPENYSSLFRYQCIVGVFLTFLIIKFVQLNVVLQNMLPTTIDSPQHKRVLRMKDNWENDSALPTLYGTYKANEYHVKLKKVNNSLSFFSLKTNPFGIVEMCKYLK